MNLNENLLGSLTEEVQLGTDQGLDSIPALEPKVDLLRRDVLAEDFRGKVDNIYEAIIVLSQRARQIGQQQAGIIEQFLSSKIKPDIEETEEEPPEKRSIEADDEDSPKLPRFEKPTVLAMNEMLKGDLGHKFKE